MRRSRPNHGRRYRGAERREPRGIADARYDTTKRLKRTHAARGVGALGAGGSASAPLSMSARDTTISGIRWDGKPLPGLLDAVTARLGLSWSFRDGAVQIHYLDTKVFRIYAIQSKTNMQSVVQSGTQLSSSGAGGQGASGATSSSGSGGSTVSGARRRPLWSRLSRTWPKTSIA